MSSRGVITSLHTFFIPTFLNFNFHQMLVVFIVLLSFWCPQAAQYFWSMVTEVNISLLSTNTCIYTRVEVPIQLVINTDK